MKSSVESLMATTLGISARRATRVGRQLVHRMLRQVVEHDGNRDRVRDRLVVGDDVVGRGLDEKGRQNHHAVAARVLGALAERDHVRGPDRAGTGDHGDPALDLVDADAIEVRALFVRHGPRLARAARDDHALHLVGDGARDVFAELVLVDGAVRVERRDQGRPRALPIDGSLVHSGDLPLGSFGRSRACERAFRTGVSMAAGRGGFNPLRCRPASMPAQNKDARPARPFSPTSISNW